MPAENGSEKILEESMLRYLLVMSALILLTACSELRVVGNAAVRELMAEGINVEQSRLAKN